MHTNEHPDFTTAAHAEKKSAMEPVIGVLNTLSLENAEIRNLLSKLSTDAQSVSSRRHYLPLLSKAVVAHVRTQRRVLLPALLTPEVLERLTNDAMSLSPEIRPIVTQPLQRWQAAQRVVMRKLEVIKRTPPMKFAWRGNFDALAAAIEEYIDEEQRVVYPIATQLLNPLKLLSLDIRYGRERNNVVEELFI